LIHSDVRQLIAATTTLDDLKTYFKGENWRSTVRDDGTFESRSNTYLVEFKPSDTPQFAVEIHAYEDDSDRDEAVTDKPMKFLADFLKTGTEGDEALQKMARTLEPAYRDGHIPPVVIANLLRAWAIYAEERRLGPRALARLLRHASLLPDIGGPLRLLAAAVRLAARADVEQEKMQELADQMTKKGWRVKVGKNEHGMPEMTVDIAGVYEAKIEVDHIPWQYSFEVHEYPDSKKEGVTDDPIAEFRRYFRSDEVQTIRHELRQKHKDVQQGAAEEGTMKAAPHSKSKEKPEPEEPHAGYQSGG
jgi:hypothetical protein